LRQRRIHAREEILELAEMIDAPVVAFRTARHRFQRA